MCHSNDEIASPLLLLLLMMIQSPCHILHSTTHHSLSLSLCRSVLTALLDHTNEKTIVDGGTVRLTKFGSLSRKTSKARMGTNPQTMAQMKIPEKQRIKFKASGVLKEQVN
mmetsp:Transcript_21554/g.60000  ORF Transcript_21554/g.60000 Transcript_21554/m.60000 type:complete len:111 (-) Transcript_21554:1873-2205(-)